MSVKNTDFYKKTEKPDLKQSELSSYKNQIEKIDEKDLRLKKTVSVFFIAAFAMLIAVNIFQSIENEKAYKISMDSLEKLRLEKEKSDSKDKELQNQLEQELKQYKKIDSLEKVMAQKDSMGVIAVRALYEAIEKYESAKAKSQEFKKKYANYTK